MRKIIILMIVTLSGNFYSQVQNASQTESQSQIINFKKAEFPGGEDAYRKELFKYIHGYIDLQKYAVNGLFVFSFEVDTDGKTKNLSVTPRVKNSEMFIDDMLFCMKRVKTKWKPATENGVPVKSIYNLKINFITDHFDHD